MIPNHRLEQLVCFIGEEINALNAMQTIDKSIFYNENSNIIDYYHLFKVQANQKVASYIESIIINLYEPQLYNHIE